MKFVVVGKAEPQGSARAFVPKGWTRAVVTSDNPKNKGWRSLVADAAGRAMREHGEKAIMEGPLYVSLEFYLPRPKSLTKKKALAHLTKPDVDKLIRSCFDAMTKVVWRDDAQVVEVQAGKGYTGPDEPPYAKICVERCDR